MVKGVLLFEQGGAQIIGEIATFSEILATIETIVPQMQEQEKSRLLSRLSNEELKRILEERIAEERKNQKAE
jgi:hypothetical protein